MIWIEGLIDRTADDVVLNDDVTTSRAIWTLVPTNAGWRVSYVIALSTEMGDKCAAG